MENEMENQEPIQPVQEVPTQTPTPPVEPEKSSFMSSKWIKTGIIIAILVILLGGVYALGRSSVLKELNPSNPTIPPPDEPKYVSPAPDPTASWQTASTPNYSIKFPTDWYLESKTATYLRIQNYNPVGAPGREYDPNQDKGWFSIQISKVDKTANNINDLKTVIHNLDAESIAAGFTKSSTTDKIINNNGIVGISRASITDPTEPPTVYLLDGKGNIYFVGPGLDLSAGKNYFNDILNTLKFIDSTSSIDNSTWKTYTNSKYGVALEYPSNWKTDPSEYMYQGSGRVFSIYKTTPGDVRVDFHKNFVGDYCNGGSVTRKNITINSTAVERIDCDGNPQAINYKIGNDNYWLMGIFVTEKNADTFEKIFSSFKIN